MRYLVWFALYLVFGEIIHWSSLFIVFGILSSICGDNTVLFTELYRKQEKKHVGFNLSAWPEAAKFLMTQILWPISVYNTLFFGIPTIFEAKRRLEDQNGRV